MTSPPKSLRFWFKVHFAADMIFGLPLLFFPQKTLGFFNFQSELDLTARLVGAALIGIGGVSLLANDKGMESYQTLLSLKIIWSQAALLAILLSILNGAPKEAWIFFIIFAAFSALWITYKIKLHDKKS